MAHPPVRDAFTFDPDTRLFVATGSAYLSPEQAEQGVYLYPPNATLTPPPTPLEGFWPRWNANLGDWEMFELPPPPEPDVEESMPLVMPVLRGLRAMALLTVDPDGGVAGVETSVGFSMAMELEPGVYWLFFAGAFPNLNYIVNRPAARPSELAADVTDYQLDMIEVSVRNAAGVLTRPDALSLTVFG